MSDVHIDTGISVDMDIDVYVCGTFRENMIFERFLIYSSYTLYSIYFRVYMQIYIFLYMYVYLGASVVPFEQTAVRLLEPGSDFRTQHSLTRDSYRSNCGSFPNIRGTSSRMPHITIQNRELRPMFVCSQQRLDLRVMSLELAIMCPALQSCRRLQNIGIWM